MVTKFDDFVNESIFGKNYRVTITELQLGIKVTYHFNDKAAGKPFWMQNFSSK